MTTRLPEEMSNENANPRLFPSGYPYWGIQPARFSMGHISQILVQQAKERFTGSKRNAEAHSAVRRIDRASRKHFSHRSKTLRRIETQGN